MRFSHFLFLGGWFVASFLSLWAQNVDSIGVQPLQPQSYTSSLSRIDAVEVGGSLGYVLVMDQYQRAWTSGTSLSNVIFSLRHRTLSDSTDIFAHDYHYPTWDCRYMGESFTCYDAKASFLGLGATATRGLCLAPWTSFGTRRKFFATTPTLHLGGMGICH